MEEIGGIVILIILGILALPLAIMALLPAGLSMALIFLATQLLYKAWLNHSMSRGWMDLSLRPDTDTGNLKVQFVSARFVDGCKFLILSSAAIIAIVTTTVIVKLFSQSPDFGGFKAFVVFVFAQIGWIWFSVRFYRFGDHREMLQRAAAAALDAPGLSGKFATLKNLDEEATALLRQTGTASDGWSFGIESWLRTVPYMGLGDSTRVHQEIDQQMSVQQEAIAQLRKCVERVEEANGKVIAATRLALKSPKGLFWETAISDEKEKLQYEQLYSLLLMKRWADFHGIMDEIVGGLDRAIAEMERGEFPDGASPNGAGSSIKDRAAALDFFGASEDTPLEEIAALRKELLFKYHQDQNASMSEKARRHLDRRLGELQEAWELLSRDRLSKKAP